MAAAKFSISISQDNLDKLDKISKIEDRSKNWIINKAIENYIVEYELKYFKNQQS